MIPTTLATLEETLVGLDVVEDIKPDAALQDLSEAIKMFVTPLHTLSSLAERPLLHEARFTLDGAAETAIARERIGRTALKSMLNSTFAVENK